jgi:hypothetical protein
LEGVQVPPSAPAHVHQAEAEVREHLLDAQAHGWTVFTHYAGDGGWSLTESGKVHGERLLAAELDAVGASAAVEAAHEDFLLLNGVVAAACTAWQLAELGIGEHLPTLSGTIAALAAPAAALGEIEGRLSAQLERFAGYQPPLRRRPGEGGCGARVDHRDRPRLLPPRLVRAARGPHRNPGPDPLMTRGVRSPSPSATSS